LGRLHGVPFTVKENIDLEGTPTTQGVPMLADAVASTDAPSVARMRAAGAIPIGRTNMPDLGLRVHTMSSLHGLTRNPWHHERTAGGSSGGEAAALATGMSPIGIGNDIGGSLRNPAHCCGVASIKPTTGVVARATVVPPTAPGISGQQMAVEGPMARRVADVRAGLEILAGADRRDPVSVPARLGALGRDERIRVGVLAAPPGGDTHPAIVDAVRSAATVLEAAGHEVVEVQPPAYEEIVDLWTTLLLQDIVVNRDVLDAVMSEDARGLLNTLADGAQTMPTLESVTRLQSRRFEIQVEWSQFFADHDVIVTPTWALPAFEHDADLTDLDRVSDTIRPVVHANFLGLPAAVVPHGTADGLPVGVQVIGDRFSDLRCLDVAEIIDKATATQTPIDPRV